MLVYLRMEGCGEIAGLAVPQANCSRCQRIQHKKSFKKTKNLLGRDISCRDLFRIPRAEGGGKQQKHPVSYLPVKRQLVIFN